jgi:hypothetical protein
MDIPLKLMIEAKMLRISCFAIAVLAFMSGCAKPPPPIVPVHGVVRLNGVPLNKAEVLFMPVEDFGAEYVAKGVTDQAGHFTLLCKGEEGACAGDNRVLVKESEIPRELHTERAQAKLAAYLESLGGRPLPPRYANLVDSPLHVDVQEGRKEYILELTTK